MTANNWTLDRIEELYKKFRPDTVNNLGKTIAIGDNDDNSRTMLRSQLQKRGFSVWSAADSLEILRIIKNHKPDCCILDMNLRPASAIDILETISRDDAYRETLVFISTSIQSKEDHIIAGIYGAKGVIKKPIQGSALADEINIHLKNRSY